MKREDILLANRRSIYNFIMSNPGSHLRRISRELDMKMGTLRHHLDYLEKMEMAVTRRVDNLKVYFAPGELRGDDKKLSSLLQQKRFRDIIILVLANPGLNCTDVSRELSLKLSTLSKYINILEERDVLKKEREGRKKVLRVTDERRIIEMLLTYRRSFWDSFVDNVLEIYFER